MVPRLASSSLLLAFGLALSTAAQSTTAIDSTASGAAADSGRVRDSVAVPQVEAALPGIDSTAFRASRLLVLPIQDSTGGYSTLRYVLRDAFLDLLVHDTLPRGAVLPGVDTLETVRPEVADSFGRGLAAGQVVWSILRHDSTGTLRLQAQRRDPYRDSVLSELTLVLPDTAELSLATIPRALLWGLFPRALPPRPALADSVKKVVVLEFAPEGTATGIHARHFTDSLRARLQGRDGFQVVARTVRDSLLGAWDPGQCLTESCRREVAERLGVPWIIAGRIEQLGDKWVVHADLLLADSAKVGRQAVAQGQGAPGPALELVIGQTARQLAGQEQPRSELNDAPIARKPVGPAWSRVLALGVASALGVTGMILSW